MDKKGHQHTVISTTEVSMALQDDYQSNTDIREKLNVQIIIYKIEELKGIPYNVNYILFACSLFI